jgi:hypothetical protein
LSDPVAAAIGVLTGAAVGYTAALGALHLHHRRSVPRAEGRGMAVDARMGAHG